MAKDLETTKKLRELNVGESTTFPIQNHASIKSTAWSVGLAEGKEFTTKCDRKLGVISVKRKS